MRYILFTTTTCPKCPEVKEFVKNIDLPGQIIDDSSPAFAILIDKFNVTAAPTFILLKNEMNGEEIFRADDVPTIESNLEKFDIRKII